MAESKRKPELDEFQIRDVAHDAALDIAHGLLLHDEDRWKIEEMLIRNLRLQLLEYEVTDARS